MEDFVILLKRYFAQCRKLVEYCANRGRTVSQTVSNRNAVMLFRREK